MKYNHNAIEHFQEKQKKGHGKENSDSAAKQVIPQFPQASEKKSRSFPDEQDLRISKLTEDFFDYLRIEKGCTERTILRCLREMGRFEKTAKNCDVRAINSECVSLYKRALFNARLSPATISVNLSTLRSFLRFLKEERNLEVFDPAKVRRPEIPKREVEYLTKDEVLRFINVIPTFNLIGLRDRALIEVLCSTGMRISEALSLKRDQIDWEEKEAQIIGKGNKQRKVFFTETALEWVTRYLEKRHDSNPALFITTGDPPRPLKSHGSWKQFHRYGKLAGLSKRIHPHLLRHTMATTLLANGCPIGHIRTLLGHANLATTCRYYLGIISEKESKVSHNKFLSYDPEEGTETEKTLVGL